MKIKEMFFRNNECFQVGRTINVRGVMLHATGANNPNLRRYVGPCEDGVIGHNPNGNHWNVLHPCWTNRAAAHTLHRFEDNGQRRCRVCGGRRVAIHGWIGKAADGSIMTVQSLPWSMRGWHSGGSANDTHIGVEICEDGLTDKTYFDAVYQEAVELCVYLCKMFNLDPLEDGVLIDHAEGRRRGIASNHADVGHWFPRHGKNMNIFRNDVNALLRADNSSTILPNTPAKPEPSFPISEENLQAMVDMGIINSPDYWRGITSVQWLNELIGNVAERAVCNNHGYRRASDAKEAIEILVNAGVINTPGYWLDVLNRGIPHFDGLLMNMANRICRLR